MYLSPTEEDRLLVFLAAELARRSMARGLRLNEPEAVALAADEMHLAARVGCSFEDVLAAGRGALSAEDLLPGVADLVEEIRLEVLLEEGSRLVVLRRPWIAGGELAASETLDVPGEADASAQPVPGEMRHREGSIELNEGRDRRNLTVRNGSERPVRISSHYPFWRANRRLEFDRDAAAGFRLDIPAGSSVHWDPAEVKEITLVRYGGDHDHAT
jgi:urease subunit gamma/beta